MTRRSDLAHLPGRFGLPLLGETLPFIRDAERWATDRFRRHGGVFTSHFMFEPVVIFADPDAAKQVLMDRTEVFSSKLGWDPTIGKLFARGLMLRDFDDHRFHRRIMQAAFRSDAMAGYLDEMHPLVVDAVSRWQGADEVDVYADIKQLTLDIAASVFVGIPPGPEASRLNVDFITTLAASIAPVRWELPGTAMRRGMAARRNLERFFAALIPRHRAAGGTDMLTRLCHAESEDGERFDDQEIIDHMIFLLLAAHDTTTSTLATMAWELAQREDLQETLRTEAAALEGGRVTWEQRNDLPEMDYVFREAMRLHPPVPFIPRRLLADAEIAGASVPAGTMISVSPLLIHRLPDVWSSPLSFDPQRFAPGREEHKAHSHVYVPFSGGAHTCIGMHFAAHMAKAILTEVLLRYRLAPLPGQTVKIQTVPIPKPRGGLPLRLQTLA
jgi:cytochrome P450